MPVTLKNLRSTIDGLDDACRAHRCLVMNLCDGNEVDGSPGVSVVRALEDAAIPFTGSSSFFYDITTYKVALKSLLRDRGVPTAPFVALRDLPADVARIGAEVGYPAFVKPEVSAGSGGIGLKSRVHDEASVMARVATLLASEDGEFYRRSGIFAERFIDGPEFTVLVVADRRAPHGARAYPPAQRLFHSALPRHERFLSYDRYWSEYKEESAPARGRAVLPVREGARAPAGPPRGPGRPGIRSGRRAGLRARRHAARGRERRTVRPGGQRELRDFRRQGNIRRGNPAAVGDPGHHAWCPRSSATRTIAMPPTGTGAGPDPCASACCSRRTRDPRATTGTTTRPATSRYLLPEHEFHHEFLNKASAFSQIKALQRRGFDVYVNLCEGYRDSDVPSIDVIHALEDLNLPFTGPTSRLYDPSKDLMKLVALSSGVGVPAWQLVGSGENGRTAANGLRYPLFVKPSAYGDSMGIDEHSLVATPEELDHQVSAKLPEFGRLLIEEYIDGREFTVLVMAGPDPARPPVAFTPLEFIFPPGLHFKTYDLKVTQFHPECNVPCTEAGPGRPAEGGRGPGVRRVRRRGVRPDGLPCRRGWPGLLPRSELRLLGVLPGGVPGLC